MRTAPRTVHDLLSLYLADARDRVDAEEICQGSLVAYAQSLQAAQPLEGVLLADLSADHLETWRLGHLERPVATQKVWATRLATVLRWGRAKGFLHADLAASLFIPRARPKRGCPLSVAELQELLAACRLERASREALLPDADDLLWARFTSVAAFIETQALTGARNLELRQARPGHLNGASLEVRGKRRTRALPLSRPALELLTERKRRIGDRHAFLFPGNWDGPLTQAGVFCGFRRLAGAAGVGRSPHDLRHSFVTMSRAAGATWRQIADACGHICEATTIGIYDHCILTPGARQAADGVAMLLGEVV